MGRPLSGAFFPTEWAAHPPPQQRNCGMLRESESERARETSGEDPANSCGAGLALWLSLDEQCMPRWSIQIHAEAPMEAPMHRVLQGPIECHAYALGGSPARVGAAGAKQEL